MSDAKVTPLGHDDEAKPGAGDARFYSVTTLIGALDKPALIYWAAEQTAIAACKVAGSLEARIAEDGAPQVIKWLRDARLRPPKDKRSAAELGSAVHDAIETYALTGVRPETDSEVRPFLDRFDEWAQVFSPRYEAAEAAVYNRTDGYAGTLDAICVVDGMRLLVTTSPPRRTPTAAASRPVRTPRSRCSWRRTGMPSFWRRSAPAGGSSFGGGTTCCPRSRRPSASRCRRSTARLSSTSRRFAARRTRSSATRACSTRSSTPSSAFGGSRTCPSGSSAATRGESHMSHTTFTIGDRYRDRVSGFAGIIVARIEYLDGCVQYELKPPVDKDGKNCRIPMVRRPAARACGPRD